MRFRLPLSALLVFIISIGGCSTAGIQVYKNPDTSAGDIGYLQVSIPPIGGLPASDWINATPDIVDSLKGKVVLFDFWDYTCVNCVRTIPNLKEWYKRYHKDGLVIIGIHTPEFAFAMKRKNVETAVKSFGIKYPVVLDNNDRLWNEFGNQVWPEEYLFDSHGLLRYNHSGDVEYGNTEYMIQKLLRDRDGNIDLPPIMKPLSPTEGRGAVCYRPTAETYLGFGSGEIGNRQGYRKNVAFDYVSPRSVKNDRFYLTGRWKAERQYVRYAGKASKGKILLNYAASSVNLVIRPDYHGVGVDAGRKPFDVYVYLDNLPVPETDRPSGMKVGKGGKTYIVVREPRMYDLIMSKKFGRHTLTLVPESDSFAAYSFTFGTTCTTS